MMDTLRILTFAGHPVPEDGLSFSPPQGGKFTVWPDGRYAYTPPDGGVALETGASVSTFYSYVMEDVDGEVTVGTFALTPGAATLEHSPDFQSWSLDDILALEDIVGLTMAAPASVAELSGFEARGAPGADLDLNLEAGDLTFDILEHAIKTSWES